MERGFKSYANGLVLEVRGELGLSPVQPLDPWVLADFLAIRVEPLSSFGADAPLATRVFRTSAKSAFSAVTVLDGHRRRITYNDYHARNRQTSNLAHELAHGLLMHPPAPALDGRGLVVHRSEIEDQASFMGAALLVPEGAALAIVANGMALADAAAHYGVSLGLLRWRVNSTGAVVRVARSRQQARPGVFTRSASGHP